MTTATAGFLTEEEQAQFNQSANGFEGDGSGFDDGFGFDTDGIDPAEAERGAFVDKEGQYHFEITDVKFDTSKVKGTPFVEFCLTVLQSVKGQSPEGSRFNHQSYLSEGARLMTSAFGHRIGALKLLPTGEIDEKGQPKHVYVDPKTNSRRITKETWLAVKGSQFVGTLRLGKERQGDDGREYKARLELQTNKCWQTDAEEVADVPKNLQAMKLIGKKPYTPPAAASGDAAATKKPASTPAQTKPAPAASTAPDDLSDL